MDQVCNDREPVIMTRSGDQAVVMVSLEDYKAIDETAYLSRGPKNAKRLLASIRQLESGNGQVRKLKDV